MMRKILFMWVVFLFLLAFGPFGSAAAGPHPEVILIDYNGNEISPESRAAYSPRYTCGECHDYDIITNAYHFQQGRTDAQGNIVVSDGLDSKNPWLVSRGMYGKW